MQLYAHNFLAWFYWNPPREVFTVPLIDRPVAWYGVLFVLGFILGYFLIIPIFSRFLYRSNTLSALDILNWPILIEFLQSNPQNPIVKRLFSQLSLSGQLELKGLNANKPLSLSIKTEVLNGLKNLAQQSDIGRESLEKTFPSAIATARHTSYLLADHLCWFIVLGTLIGARLGAVFFYDWPYYQSHPLEIFKIWKGGLASHGGALGVGLALYFYVLYMKKWIPSLTFLTLLDAVCVPAALAACFIRLGNFVNQEILGTPTSVPWAIIFGDPADGSRPTPRHPVQLYEGAVYLLTFILLYYLWKKKGNALRTGVISGILLISVFASRFILEFWKSHQESAIENPYFQMGQLLSIPFILIGLFFLLRPKSNKSPTTNL